MDKFLLILGTLAGFFGFFSVLLRSTLEWVLKNLADIGIFFILSVLMVMGSYIPTMWPFWLLLFGPLCRMYQKRDNVIPFEIYQEVEKVLGRISPNLTVLSRVFRKKEKTFLTVFSCFIPPWGLYMRAKWQPFFLLVTAMAVLCFLRTHGGLEVDLAHLYWGASLGTLCAVMWDPIWKWIQSIPMMGYACAALSIIYGPLGVLVALLSVSHSPERQIWGQLLISVILYHLFPFDLGPFLAICQAWWAIHRIMKNPTP